MKKAIITITFSDKNIKFANEIVKQFGKYYNKNINHYSDDTTINPIS